MRNSTIVSAFAVLTLALVSAGAAHAGRGGSPLLIKSAIAADSVDSIQAELERSEYLVCAPCTELVAPLVDHGDYRVRKAAAWWLARRSSGRQVYISMLQRLSQADSVKARNAADILGEFAYPTAIPALAAALSNPIFSGEARASMARALGNIGRPAGQAALVGALSAPEGTVKVAALAALREIEGFKDARVAEPLLNDADEQVRAQAVLTFGALRNTDGASGLVRLLQSDPSENVRKKAAWALGEMGAPAGMASAVLQTAAASDSSPLVRSLAASAIVRLTR